MFSSRFSDCSSAAIDFDASSDYFKVHLYPDPWGFKTGNNCINFIEKMFLYSSAMLILLVPSTIFFTLQTYRSFLKPYIQLRKHQDRNQKYCRYLLKNTVGICWKLCQIGGDFTSFRILNPRKLNPNRSKLSKKRAKFRRKISKDSQTLSNPTQGRRNAVGFNNPTFTKVTFNETVEEKYF